MLEKNIIRKGRVNKSLKLELEPDTRDDVWYKVEAIEQSAIYVTEVADQLSRFYYLVSWKGYLEVEST